MAVFHNETLSFWVAPKPKDKWCVLYDELSSECKKKFDASRFKEIDHLLQLGTLSVMTIRDSENSSSQILRTSYRRICWANRSVKMMAL